MADLIPTCDKLPAGVSKATMPLSRYDREFSWGNSKHKYSRTKSGHLWLTAEQHEMFFRLLAFATTASNTAYKLLLDKAGETRQPLDDDDVHEIMRTVDDISIAKGFAPDTATGIAASRAAAHTLSVCWGYLKEGRYPLPKYSTSQPLAWALPVRLARGQLYGKPVTTEPAGAGVWLDLGLPGGGERPWLAPAPALPAGRRIEESSWCEFTFWDQAWRLRFVFGDELTPEEQAARKVRAAEREAKLTAEEREERKAKLAARKKGKKGRK